MSMQTKVFHGHIMSDLQSDVAVMGRCAGKFCISSMINLRNDSLLPRGRVCSARHRRGTVYYL